MAENKPEATAALAQTQAPGAAGTGSATSSWSSRCLGG